MAEDAEPRRLGHEHGIDLPRGRRRPVDAHEAGDDLAPGRSDDLGDRVEPVLTLVGDHDAKLFRCGRVSHGVILPPRRSRVAGV